MKKKNIKKLGIIGLSCLLALSSAANSLAAVNGTGGGSVSTDSKIDWIGNFWKLHLNQGVRFTIVNQEGMLDFMKKQNMQVIFCSPDKTESIGNECEVILPVLRVRADSMQLGVVQFHEEKTYA